MPVSVGRGIVKIFFPDRRFGRITPDGGGRRIWIHFNDGCDVTPDWDESKLVKPGERLEDPQEGDRVVVLRDEGAKGPKASPWAFEEDWEYSEFLRSDADRYFAEQDQRELEEERRRAQILDEYDRERMAQLFDNEPNY